MRKILGRMLNRFANNHKKISYSQCGEDIIIDHILKSLKVDKPVYIDIGAHHPFQFSNTALFYKSGCRGVNIEPDPVLFKLFEKYRKNDINLNIGISDKPGESLLYIMSSQTMNTFSMQEAENLVLNHGFTVTNKIKVPIDTISNVVEKYLNNTNVDILSIDVEGLELQIFESIDFTVFLPTVICAETISYSTKGLGIKDIDLIKLLKNNDYMVYADTYINTIFVRKDLWFDH